MPNIDYGRGLTNIDLETGIRYGVISQHSMGDGFFDEWESEYGDAHCPSCGNPAKESSEADEDESEAEWFSGKDYYCAECQECFWSDSAFPDDPIGHHLETDGYHAIDCLDSDVMIVKSDYYTFAPFCSPCVPGACSIDNGSTSTEPINTDWAKAYCFSHDWFEGNKAPYRVFRVSDDSEVLPDC